MISLSDTETVASLIPEIKPLIGAHYREIARHQKVIPLNPDYDRYLELEKNGNLHIVTARDGRELIGYFICILSYHIHYQDSLMAISDLIYVHPGYRRQFIGQDMIRYALPGLKERNVVKLVMNVKKDHDFGSMLEHLGFVQFETLYDLMLR